MEAKLKEYRALRRRREIIDNAKEKVSNTKEKLVNLLVPKIFRNMGKEKNEDEVVLIDDINEDRYINEEPPPPSLPKKPLIQPEEDLASETSEIESFVEESKESWQYCITKWSLYTIIWTSLYIYFLSLQFGAVFFSISVLIGIFLNTRTQPKKKGEVSAYSVFNQNCQSIDGTLKAEELQRQMFYGIGGIKAV